MARFHRRLAFAAAGVIAMGAFIAAPLLQPDDTVPEPDDRIIVVAADFEEGFDGWTARDNGTGSPRIIVTDQDSYGGEKAATVTERTSQGSGIGTDVTGLLWVGATYEVSAALKFAPGEQPDDIWLTMRRSGEGGDTYDTVAQFTGLSNVEWVEFTARFTPGEHESAYLYFETAYTGTNTSTFMVDEIIISIPASDGVSSALTPISDSIDVPIGVAIDSRETVGDPSALLLHHFDQVTAENHMKPEAWYDAGGGFAPHADVDAIMTFARQNHLRVYGHVLVWHDQTPEWFFQDAAGRPLSDSPADQAVLRERMRGHIFAVAEYLAGQYGPFGSDSNPLNAFDVVNEVVADEGGHDDGLRRSEWYRILGEGFVDLAFEYADEAFNGVYADPAADRPVTLFINEYNTEVPDKRDRYVALIERLRLRGVPVDGVGHQFHLSLAVPVSALEEALIDVRDLGLVQAVTEMDVTTGTPVSNDKLIAQGEYYRDAFRVFRAHEDDLFAITLWGLSDNRSWRNARGAPLLFDGELRAKQAYYGVVDAAGDLGRGDPAGAGQDADPGS